jgi:hypothetical protein
MKTIIILLISSCFYGVFAQKTVTTVLKLENVTFGSCTAQTVPFKYSIKNYGPNPYVFHGAPTTPIDDLTFSVYLSNNETIETGILGGENDPRIGTFVPGQQTLAVGGIAFSIARVAVNNPPYSSYKYMIIEVSYVSGAGMTATTFLARKYRISLGQVVFD